MVGRRERGREIGREQERAGRKGRRQGELPRGGWEV